MNIGKRWSSTSPSTLIPDPAKEHKAFAYHMTPEEVKMMDKWETVPKKYLRKEIELTDKEGVVFMGQAYFMNPDDQFVFPSEEYLQACSKTSMAYYYLPPRMPSSEIDYYNIKFDVINAITGKKEGVYKGKVEYDEYTQKLINKDK